MAPQKGKQAYIESDTVSEANIRTPTSTYPKSRSTKTDISDLVAQILNNNDSVEAVMSRIARLKMTVGDIERQAAYDVSSAGKANIEDYVVGTERGMDELSKIKQRRDAKKEVYSLLTRLRRIEDTSVRPTGKLSLYLDNLRSDTALPVMLDSTPAEASHDNSRFDRVERRISACEEQNWINFVRILELEESFRQLEKDDTGLQGAREWGFSNPFASAPGSPLKSPASYATSTERPESASGKSLIAGERHCTCSSSNTGKVPGKSDISKPRHRGARRGRKQKKQAAAGNRGHDTQSGLPESSKKAGKKAVQQEDDWPRDASPHEWSW